MWTLKGRPGRAWRNLCRWRRGRPFGAGVFTLLSGVVIAIPPYAAFRWGEVLISITTLGGVSALLIGTLLVVCGLSLWLRPRFRFAAGITAMLLSLVALSAANLGGFLIGSLLGMTGAALALAWTDDPRRPRPTGTWLRRGAVVVGVATIGVHGAPMAAVDLSPSRSWTLVAGAVRMDGVVYHGIHRLAVDGRSTRVMRFTVQRLRITDAVQTGPLGGGHDLVIEAPSAVASRVELNALRLAGNLQLLGLLAIPVDFTPDHPPPLVPPVVVLTDVTAVNAQMSGAALSMSRARLTVRR